MTTILRTPKAWPAILLPDRDAGGRPIRSTSTAAREAGAFAGLRRALHDLGPTGTIATIAASGLRGRGGAGFPTGEKWRPRPRAPRRPALRRGQRLRRGPVVARPTGPSSSATRTPSSRARSSPPSRSARARRSSRSGPTRPTRSGPLETALERMLAAGPRRRRRPRLRADGRGLDPAGPGRLHARRGDRPPEGPRGQARPARAAAAASRRARPVRPADGRPERPDPRRRPVDPRQRRRGVRRDRLEGEPRHDPRLGPGARRGRRRRGPDRDAAPRDRRPRRSRGPGAAELKALLVGGPSGGILPAELADTAVRVRRPARRSAPTSARARSSRPTSAPASSTSPGS